MKKLSVVALIYGALLGVVSVAGFMLLRQGNSPVNGWFATVLAEQATSIGQWRFHWALTCSLLGLVAVVAVVLAVAMWRNSAAAARLWLVLTASVLLFQVVLFFARPLPFAFQQVSILDVCIQTAVLVLSVFFFARVDQPRRPYA